MPTLVEFQPGHISGLDFVRIEREFSGRLRGQRVDMVTPKFLNPRIRDHVLSSAEPLYVSFAPTVRSLVITCPTKSLAFRYDIVDSSGRL